MIFPKMLMACSQWIRNEAPVRIASLSLVVEAKLANVTRDYRLKLGRGEMTTAMARGRGCAAAYFHPGVSDEGAIREYAQSSARDMATTKGSRVWPIS
jgi:hypothetical protein